MKKILFAFTALLLSFSLFAYEWPIENFETNATRSFFGQNKGGILSTSLVFTEPSPIHATEKGKILIIMTDEEDDNDFFPSTLGTSCIIQHDDNLISVYGNLDSENLETATLSKTKVESGDILGYSGNSGWQDNRSSLEFQIVDTGSKAAINPKIILSRSTEKNDISITNVFVTNKNGDVYDLKNSKSFSSGIYRFYQTRKDIYVPFRSSIGINGVIADQISYDTIIQENGKSCVIGKKKYSSTDIYPNDNLILIGEAMMTAGRTAVTITVQDMLENTKIVNYTLNIY